MHHRTFTALLAILVPASICAASSAVSEPVGFTRQQIENGQQTIGITLNNPAVFSGTVIANSSDAVMLATAGREIGPLLDPTHSYYMEIVAGVSDTFVGDRFDVDAAMTASVGGGVVALAESIHNSMPLSLPVDQMAGYRVSIKRHLTLREVFGSGSNGGLRAAVQHSDADQVLMFNRTSGSFETYFLQMDATSGATSWRQLGRFENCDNRVIAPGAGLFVRHPGRSAVSFVHLGGVRTNDFVMPLGVGYNFITSPYPVASTPLNLQMTPDNGFASVASATGADKIMVFNGHDYDTYLLRRSPALGIESWQRAEDADAGFSTPELLNAFNSVFIYKVTADPHFIARNS